LKQEYCIQIAQRYIEKAAAQQGGEEVTFKEFKRFTNQVVKGIGAEIEKEKLSKVFEEMAMEDSDLLAKEEFGENIFKILKQAEKALAFKEIVNEMKAQIEYTELDEETCRELVQKFMQMEDANQDGRLDL